VCTRVFDRSEPQRRLPDASLAFEDERARAVRLLTVDECPKGGELSVPTDDLGRVRQVTIVTDDTTNSNLGTWK